MHIWNIEKTMENIETSHSCEGCGENRQDHDGLNVEWLNAEDYHPDDVPFAVQRLNSSYTFDNPPSEHGEEESVVDDIGSGSLELNEISLTGENNVRDLSHSLFQSKLIEHFDIAFEKNEIVWPRR